MGTVKLGNTCIASVADASHRYPKPPNYVNRPRPASEAILNALTQRFTGSGRAGRQPCRTLRANLHKMAARKRGKRERFDKRRARKSRRDPYTSHPPVGLSPSIIYIV